MRTKKFIEETMTDMEMTGLFRPAIPARGPSYSSGGEPGEPAEVEDLEVVVTIEGQRIDVTSLLSEETVRKLCEDQAERMVDRLYRELKDRDDERVQRKIDEMRGK